jgi:hypothetical protein
MENKRDGQRLPATPLGPKAGDFPIGSLESRVAARSMLEARAATERPGILISFVGRGIDPNRKCTCKAPPPGTIAFCQCRSVSPNTDREATAGFPQEEETLSDRCRQSIESN